MGTINPALLIGLGGGGDIATFLVFWLTEKRNPNFRSKNHYIMDIHVFKPFGVKIFNL